MVRFRAPYLNATASIILDCDRQKWFSALSNVREPIFTRNFNIKRSNLERLKVIVHLLRKLFRDELIKITVISMNIESLHVTVLIYEPTCFTH